MTNSRVYMIGGHSLGSITGLSSVYTAAINADGTIGAWISAPSLPGGYCHGQSVVTSSRVYLFGGYTTTSVATVYTAPINPDGTLGTWTTDAAMPVALSGRGVAVTNNRVYLLGGMSGATAASTIFGFGTYSAAVHTAPINTDGTIGAWTTATSLPGTLCLPAILTTNTHLYIISGKAGTATGGTYRADINVNGTLGPFTATDVNYAAGLSYRGMGLLVTSSRVYLLGGFDNGGQRSFIREALSTGGSNDYMDKSYVAIPGAGQFRIPNLSQDDLRRPGLYSYIKY
jgi:hypothetical protein